MKPVTFLLALTLTAFAQAPAEPEIRGVVAELGTRAPLAGATVTLYEFAPNEENVLVRKAIATAATGPDGAYSFKTGHLGRFMVGVTKDSYRESINSDEPPLSVVDLDAKNSVQTVRFGMTRTASLTGRVVDRDGNPLANIRVLMDEVRQPGAAFLPGNLGAITNSEGIFTRQNLTPGSYIVHVGPQFSDEKSVSAGEELTPFTEDEFKIIDQDYETSYWPGGVRTPKEVLPITVPGGGIANVGTITVRKVPYYRVHVSYKGDCSPNERWQFRVGVLDRGVIQGKPHYSSCRKEGILRLLAPGAYQLGLWSGRDIDRWTIVPFTITDTNVEVSLKFSEPFTLTGHVTTPSGGPDLKTLGRAQFSVTPSNGLPSFSTVAEMKDGKFIFNRVQWNSHSINTFISNPDVYVKEIRYNGLPLRTYEFEGGPGGEFDIILDSGAASLNVTLKKGDAVEGGFAMLIPVSMASLPPLRGQFPPFVFMGQTGGTLPVAFKNLPPGEYRLYAGGANLRDFLEADPDILARFQQMPQLTLERGEQKSIEVQLRP